ncbi:MAG: hypothetical protein K0R92_609 [Lachnospiraceae bacterium]|jgi:hypothetical protein|nr:hypothetical protein [Lachnospiraceae bacterium]
MKELIVDRFEGNCVVCETLEKKIITLPISEIPDNTKEGDILLYKQGRYIIDINESDTRKERIKKKMNQLFE